MFNKNNNHNLNDFANYHLYRRFPRSYFKIVIVIFSENFATSFRQTRMCFDLKFNKRQVKLRTKINGLILLNLLFVLILFIVTLSLIMVHREYGETGDNALAVAKTVAGLPEVIEAFKEP